MPLQRRPTRIRRGFILVLAAGAIFGTFGGLQIRDRIRQAGFTGMFDDTIPAPAAVASEKQTEEELAIGAALAAQLKVESPADCRNLSLRYRSGCRAYLRERRMRDDIFGPLPREHQGNWLDAALDGVPPAAEWPAALD